MRSVTKMLLVYAGGLAIVWILMPVAVAVAGAGLAGRRMASDSQVAAQVQRILREHGIDPADMPDSLPRRAQWVKDLPEEARRDLQTALEGHLARSVNWRLVGAVSTLILYGGVGFVCGYLTRTYLLLGVIPVGAMVLGNPLGGYTALPRHATLSGSQWVLFAALAAVYLLGYTGARLARWRDRQHWARPGAPRG